MKACISGGCGFIGSHLAESLVADGHEVTIIDDLSTGSLPNVGEIREKISLRVCDCALSRITEKEVAKADLVFHLAATVGVKKVMEDPIATMSNMRNASHTVIEACALHHKRLILTSSSEVYGASTKEAFSEEDDCIIGPTTKSRWCYAATKLMDEFLALAYHKSQALPVTVVRLFNTIGPRQSGQYGMVVPTFVRQALKGELLPVYGDGKQKRCFSSVHDVVKCLRALAHRGASVGEVVNIGSTVEVSVLALAEEVLAVTDRTHHHENLGLDTPFKWVNPNDAYGEDFVDMRHRKPDVSKLKRLIGFVPETPLSEILKEIVEHERRT